VSAVTEADLIAYLKSDLLGGQDVASGDSLLLSGLVDSLGVMTLVAHLEGVSGKKIPLDQVVLENFDSVGAIVGFMGQLE